MMEIFASKLSYSEALNLLLKSDADFDPLLSTSLDLEKYASKLSTYADFLLLEDVSDYYGCIAYYQNFEGRFLYISHYWVSNQLQGQGYGSRMFRKLIEISSKDFDEVRLEVVKTNPAMHFYQKHGFRIIEDRNHKVLMSLRIRN